MVLADVGVVGGHVYGVGEQVIRGDGCGECKVDKDEEVGRLG